MSPAAVPVDLPSASARPTSGWRDSTWLALVELALAAMIFGADRLHLIYFSVTPYLFLLGWISLRLRRVGWRRVGFTPYRNWPTTLLLGVLGGGSLEAFQLFVSQPVLIWLTGKPPDLSVFNALTGNIKLALLGLVAMWTLAAFGEEMVYRGYLLNRVADVGRRTRWAWAASTLIVTAVFGFAHSYQGVTGIIDEGLMGLLLALMYFATRRNLAVPIVAHGVQDSIDLLLIYLGSYPLP